MTDLLMVKKTQIEMLSDRGYNIDKEAWLLNDDFINEEHKYLKKFKHMSLNHKYFKDGTDNSLYVLYIKDNDELLIVMKEFQKKMLKSSVGIVIANTEQLKKLAKKIYEDYFDPLKQIQLFNYDELTFNLTKHIFCPTYEVIDKSTIIPSLVHANQLPVILANDPASKYYGWVPGQVIKVIDDNFTTDVLSDYHISYCIISSRILK